MEQSLFNRVMEQLQEVVTYLYQENIPEAYRQLAMVIPSLQQILDQMENEELQRELMEKLQMALQAMENQDAILLADILSYEIMEKLQELG
jgi:PAS domain-containing protein